LPTSGFCCDNGSAVSKSGLSFPSGSSQQVFCDRVGEDGCFLGLESLSVPVPVPRKSWCSSVDDCVFDVSQNLSVCEVSKVCSDVLSSVVVSDSDLVCSNFSRSVSSLGVLHSLRAGCDASVHTSGCLVRNVTVCNESLGVVCDSDGFNCRSLFVPASCRSVSTFHGPFCEISNGCDLPVVFDDVFVSLPLVNVTKNGVEVSVPDVSSCSNVSVVRSVNSSFSSSLDDGVFRRLSVCGVEDFCSFSDDFVSSVVCLSSNNSLGSPVRLVSGLGSSSRQDLFCEAVSSQSFGDYWCPVGYKYKKKHQGTPNELELCYKEYSYCDQGFAGSLEHGCDYSGGNPQDDPLFGAYNKECVKRKIVHPGVLAYDSVCCFDSVFNGFQLWDDALDFSHVRVY
jgi:hypothetical protein